MIAELLLIAVAVVIGGIIFARLLSAWVNWPPAGPIALLVAAPALPYVDIGAHLSMDNLLPLTGLGLLLLQTRRPRSTPSTIARIALVGVGLLTVARIGSALANASGTLDASTGLLQAFGVPVFLVAASVCVALSAPGDRRRQYMAGAMGVMGTLEAAFALIAFTVPLPGGIGVQALNANQTLGGCASRVTGTLGLSPNHVGAVLVLTLPLTLAVATESVGWRRWAWVAGAALQGTTLVFTFTRASIILAGIAAIVFLLYNRQWKLLGVAAALCIALVFGISAQACGLTRGGGAGGSHSGGSGIGNAPGIIADRFSDANDRLALWYSAARMMLDHPLFGVGIGRSQVVLGTNPAEYVQTPFGTATNSAHNTILLAGAETGVLGAIGAVILNAGLAVAGILMALRRRGSNALTSAAGFSILAFLAQGMVNNLFTVPATSTLLAILFGAFVSATELRRAAESTTARVDAYTPAVPSGLHESGG